jgi:hypothetical protein
MYLDTVQQYVLPDNNESWKKKCILFLHCCFNIQLNVIIPPKQSLGGIYRSCSVVCRSSGLLHIPCQGHNLKTYGWNSIKLHSMIKHNERKWLVQCTRTITPSWLITELLPFVTFPCQEHNFKTTGWNSKQLHTMVKHNKRKCSAQEP